MKRFFAILFLMGGLVVSGAASATSVTWTIPPTPLSGIGNPIYQSISGTFDWDAVNQVASNVNLVAVISSTPTPITSWSNMFLSYAYFNNVSPSSGDPLVRIDITNLTNTATPTTVANIVVGPCNLQNGNCAGFSGQPSSGAAANVTLTPAAPAPTPASVPTLSEWSQMLLGLMVLSMIGWHFHRERSV